MWARGRGRPGADRGAHRAPGPGDLPRLRGQALELRLGHATVYNLPPPTQGVTTLMILGMFERLGLGAESPEHHHALIEASKRAFTIGEQVVADPMNLVHDPAAFLTSSCSEREAARIDMRRASPIRCRACRRATRSGWGRSTRTAWRSPASSRCSGPSSGCVPPATEPLAQPRHGLLPRPGEPQSVAAGPQAVPHPQPAPGGLRRRAGPVLRHHVEETQPQVLAQIFTRYATFGMGLPMRSTRRNAGSSTRAGRSARHTAPGEPLRSGLCPRPRGLGHEVEEGLSLTWTISAMWLLVKQLQRAGRGHA